MERFEKGSEETGYASWYGDPFHGRQTASGEIYDMHRLTAAHRYAPFGTNVRVTNLSNQKSVVVRINDRGPFVKGRILDLSLAAAQKIDLVGHGTAKVKLDFLEIEKGTKTYYVQAGSFQDPKNAQHRLQALSGLFPNQSARIEISGGLSRVWFGPLAHEADAVTLVEKLRSAGFSGLIVRR